MTKPSELAAVHADVAAAAAKLKADQRIADCLEAVKRDADLTLKDQIALTEIESPPFHEIVRGQDLMRRLKELGLTEVSMDSEGNVIGIRRGTLKGEGPHLVLAAHQDTVFPAAPTSRSVSTKRCLPCPRHQRRCPRSCGHSSGAAHPAGKEN